MPLLYLGFISFREGSFLPPPPHLLFSPPPPPVFVGRMCESVAEFLEQCQGQHTHTDRDTQDVSVEHERNNFIKESLSGTERKHTIPKKAD